MITDQDLQALSQLEAGERAFLSMYFSGPRALKELKQQYNQIMRLYAHAKDLREERGYFEANVEKLRKFIKKDERKERSWAVFSCAELDYFKAFELEHPAENLLWVDTSPYIRPLAMFHKDYENVAIVIADNKKAEIVVVTSRKARARETVLGNVKNHVKVGGWSQQRYERRRDKQLLLYAKEIREELRRIHVQSPITHLIFVGGKEIMREIYDQIPPRFQKLVLQKRLDLGRDTGEIKKELLKLYGQAQQVTVDSVWAIIEREYYRTGLAVTGLVSVLDAACENRVENIIIQKGFNPTGSRCGSCGHLTPSPQESCPACQADKMFSVDLVNEIIEYAQTAGARVYFTDGIPALKKVGDIVAQLRWRP
jgi:peptide subunit release factor 1 (eRF1)